ncbi:hypothetical protein L596_029019 [Steinernema carpocapsae]|uniref:Uncharacterized protein n=1 Tax=Steinernema carpocapsae TaxID=34508 RepID=A0A4U5LTE0_STECR|nr:hypothetical protein L596_029019 [Steinernema carpocapsae]
MPSDGRARVASPVDGCSSVSGVGAVDREILSPFTKEFRAPTRFMSVSQFLESRSSERDNKSKERRSCGFWVFWAIFKLQIPMGDSVRVEVVEGSEDLRHPERRADVSHAAHDLDDAEEVTVGSEFGVHDDGVAALDHPEEAREVWVLNADLWVAEEAM